MLHAFVLAAVLNGTVMLRPQSGADKAVGGALVELLLDQKSVATAMSASDGTFSIAGLAAGTYSIQIHSNYTQTKGTVVVHEINPNLGTEPLRKFYVFDAPCGAIFGRVHDAVTGLEVRHADVWILGNSETDPTGDFFITFGCDAWQGSYKFWGTSGVNVAARRYKRLSYFFRSEHVDGFAGNVLDFELQPIPAAPPRDRHPGR